MKKKLNQIKIIIVTFRSDSIIEKTLRTLKNFNVYLVENSNNKIFKKKIESKFKNVKCLLSGSNIGYGSAINFAIKRIRSKFFLILNPDSFISVKTIKKLYYSLEQNTSFDVIAPLTLDKKNRLHQRYGYFLNSKIKQNYFENKELKQVDFVIGCAFLIRSNIFNKIGFFDENYFMNYEEIDFFKRMRNKNCNILINKQCNVIHLEGKSSMIKGNKINSQKEFLKTSKWHLAWGKYYYYKKHYNLFITFFVCFFFLSKSLSQYLYFSLTNQKHKRQISKEFLKGMSYSILRYKSFRRPIY